MRRPQRLPRPPRPAPEERSLSDRLTMTDQLEPVGDATKERRKIDETLARFSAAHDELAEQEARRRERRERLTARPAALLEQTRTRLQRVIAPVANADPMTKLTRAVGSLAAEAAATPEAGEKPADQVPRTRLQEKKQRHQQRSVLTARITAAVLAGLVFLATGAGWGTKTWFNSKFTEISALDENSADIRNAAGQSGDQNFLIVGSDSRAGAAAEEGVGDAQGIPGARADTLMIAHIPADRQRVVVVGFPRDLEVSRPECQRWDPVTGQYTGEKLPTARAVKLNSIYAFGGPQCITKLAQQLTGMRMNHFVGIDFNGFKGMIDAVHGVPIHVATPIVDGTLGVIIPQAGDVIVSGDQALNFVRARHVDGDPTSDYGRIKRQQQVILALLKRAMSQDVMFDAGKLTAFINAFAGATFGQNIGVDQMLGLAKSMRGLDPTKINFLTVPTVGEANARGNEVLLKDKTAALFQALIENGPLPGNKPATPLSATTPGSGSAPEG
jgi:LCP family protein required for cell wall assembly